MGAVSIWNSTDSVGMLDGDQLDVAWTNWHHDTGYAVRLASLGTDKVLIELDIDQVIRLRDLLAERIAHSGRADQPQQ